MEDVAENKSVDIVKRINDYLEKNKKSKAELANEINYSRTVISKFLLGKYDGDATEVSSRLLEYIESMEGSGSVIEFRPQYSAADFKKNKTFFESRDSKGVIGVCSSCQEDMGLGIIVGKSGFGKTYALKYYSKMMRVAYIECDDTMSSRDLVEAIERALGIPVSYGTIWKRVNAIREFFNVNNGYLLIIDEADKLISKYTQKKMEILRAIYDQSDVGMVIAGEPRLEAQIKSYLTRFANRVDFYSSFKGLSKSEVLEYLSAYDIDEEAMNELIYRACGSQIGCFRLLDRTLNNVLRIMNEVKETTITLDIIRQASNMMML